MPIPSPEERPDLYDDHDFRERKFTPGEQAYWDSLAPLHVRARIAEVQIARLLGKQRLPDKLRWAWGLRVLWLVQRPRQWFRHRVG